jgi:hypothetical protein
MAPAIPPAIEPTGERLPTETGPGTPEALFCQASGLEDVGQLVNLGQDAA